jgi:hypothetical protein
MNGERTCAHCGASMQEGQDWCLRCGAGEPGNSRTAPSWRSAAIVLGATGVLVLGAAAAAYAALKQGNPAKPPTPVAQTTTTTTSTSTATTPPPSSPPTTTPTPGSGVGGGTQSPSLKTPSNPPKIPGATQTPGNGQRSRTSATTTSSSGASSTTTTTSSSTSSSTTERTGGQPVAVLLDANAAQIYNPSNLPESRFGDPSLAIDGDTTTAWTVQLEESEAPAVGAGLTLNLNAPLKISQLTLITETTGITVQVYGTKAAKVPQALHSEEWVKLSHAHLVKQRKATIKLSEGTKSFRQLLLWIVKAPTNSSGQFTASQVAINEIQLYEPEAGAS